MSAWPLFTTEFGLVALSLGCLVLDLFLSKHAQRASRLATAAMAGLTALFVAHLFSWGRFGTALGGTFVQDEFAFFFKTLFFLAAFFTLIMAREYQNRLKRGHGEFTLLILFALTGMTFIASAADFLTFFVALETLTVSLYIMTAYLRDDRHSIEAGVKYLILGALSTAVFLYGLSFIYGASGSTSYTDIAARMGSDAGLPLPYVFGVLLVTASLGFKIAAVPFHLWAPDIYEGAPTPVTAYLSIASKAAGFAALLRLLFTAFAPAAGILSAVLATMAALSVIYGNVGAIPQKNIKRLLGYSSVGHAGYLLIGVTALNASGAEATLYYLLSYLFSAAAIFLGVIAVTRATASEDISEFAGLSQRSPLLAAGMLLGLLSLAGVPPLAGFFSKFYVLWASMRAGYLWLTLIGILNVITSLYYYLKVVKVMYLEPYKGSAPLAVTRAQKYAQALAIAGILILGVWQGPFVRLAEAAITGLFR